VGLPIGLSSICLGFRDEKPIDGSKMMHASRTFIRATCWDMEFTENTVKRASALALLPSPFLYSSQKSDNSAPFLALHGSISQKTSFARGISVKSTGMKDQIVPIVAL
jgi:hypothetical protein